MMVMMSMIMSSWWSQWRFWWRDFGEEPSLSTEIDEKADTEFSVDMNIPKYLLLNIFECFGISLDIFEYIWISLDMFEYVWMYLNIIWLFPFVASSFQFSTFRVDTKPNTLHTCIGLRPQNKSSMCMYSISNSQNQLVHWLVDWSDIR